MREKKVSMWFKCDSDLIVKFAGVDKCCDATYKLNWVVELGVLFHEISNRRLFPSYKSRNFGVMKMSNYKKCMVVGIKDVNVVTNMGHTPVLKNVS